MSDFVARCCLCTEFHPEREVDSEHVCRACKKVISNLDPIRNSNLNEVCRQLLHLNKKWWINPETGEEIERNKGELLMLMVTELAESFEGIRRDLMDDHLPHRKMEEVELADLLIRVFVYCGIYELDLDGAFREKVEYNKTRKDHTDEARMSENGKKF